MSNLLTSEKLIHINVDCSNRLGLLSDSKLQRELLTEEQTKDFYNFLVAIGAQNSGSLPESDDKIFRSANQFMKQHLRVNYGIRASIAVVKITTLGEAEDSSRVYEMCYIWMRPPEAIHLSSRRSRLVSM